LDHKLFKYFFIIFSAYHISCTKSRDGGVLVALGLVFVHANADLIYSFMRSAFGLKCPLKIAVDFFLIIINTKPEGLDVCVYIRYQKVPSTNFVR